ncbi:hypothetical protein BKA82DRAFT_17999 [Pisolithus tinctorius]|uniref:Glucose-methanol-choline oxidoreductase N-terminal domain-containing protein n=1 Tax=Pisolithus tinctorius Marx 270 TaxID=870435 RepID=A0A0C3L059_PISTI|nr:hypothetical protein BKA82DRAFT_17999 [Pisolithus tinctorius]KIO15172.1 hypothetical protein M404DRAFT_17999 [Pisolithus tinctorius Marx 270]
MPKVVNLTSRTTSSLVEPDVFLLPASQKTKGTFAGRLLFHQCNDVGLNYLTLSARYILQLRAHYGAFSDFDEFAEIVGDNSWSWENFKQYVISARPALSDIIIQRRSSGPVTIGYHSYTWKGTEMFVDACVNAGTSFNPDFNTSNGTIGVNKVSPFPSLSRVAIQTTRTLSYVDHHGVRASTEAAYLTSAVLARPNLKIVTDARVTKILFDTSTPNKNPRAIGIEFSAFAQKEVSRRFRARARKGAVVWLIPCYHFRSSCDNDRVSCGAVHTPQLLMISGIGPATHLAECDIPVVADHPGVGSNLHRER